MKDYSIEENHVSANLITEDNNDNDININESEG